MPPASRAKRSRLGAIWSGRIPGGTAQVTISFSPYSRMKAASSATQCSALPTNPCLRNACFLRNPRHAAMPARNGAELVVDRHAPALALAHGRPIAFGIVGHEAGLDDTDAVIGWIASAVGRRLAPGIERLAARPLRQQIGIEPSGSCRPGLGQSRNPKGRAAGLHIARRYFYVLELGPFSCETEFFAGKCARQYFQTLVGQRQAAGLREAEATELMRRVAHADAHLDPPARQIVQHRQVLGQPDRVVERQQANVAGKPHLLGPT